MKVILNRRSKYQFNDNHGLKRVWNDFIDWNPLLKDYVRIDSEDCFSADYTSSLIMHPLLTRMMNEQHGYGAVDNEDVPEELRCTELHDEKKYKWVLGEVIWALGEISTNEKNAPIADTDSSEDYAKYDERIQNGCLLMGKYFRSFWT